MNYLIKKSFFATVSVAFTAMLAVPGHASRCIEGNQIFDSLDGELFRTESGIAKTPGAKSRYMSAHDVGVIATHMSNGVANCMNNHNGCPFHQAPGGFFNSYFDCEWTCSLEVDSNNGATWHMHDFDNLDVLIIESALWCFNDYPLKRVSFNLYAVQGHNTNPGLSSKWTIDCEPLETC